jgi:hypothetical protein
MKFNWKIVLGILLLTGWVAGAPVVGHYRAKWAFEAYRGQLIRRGEKLTAAEIAHHPKADEVSAARHFLAAARQFGSSPSNSLPVMRTLAPGRAMVGWTENVLPTDVSSNIWPAVIDEVQRHEQDLATLRTALGMPAFDFDLDYSQGFNLLLPHLVSAKQAAFWASLAALSGLHEGRATNAWEDLETCTVMPRVLAREPLMISQLVRVAMGQIASGANWEALQSSSLREEQLKELQALWESMNFMDGAEPSLEMERALAAPTYEQMRSSYATASGMGMGGSSLSMDDLGQVLANPKEGLQALMDRYPRYAMWKWQWSYEEELYHLEIQQAALEAVRAFRTNENFVSEMTKYQANRANIQKSYKGGENRFMFGFDDGTIEKYLWKLSDLEMERQLIVAAIALKRFQLHEGKYPARLQDLAPDYLATVPLDPMDGKPLRYQLKPDGTFLLYSVGEDGVDSGGDPTPSQLSDVRSKSWWKGRDAVWPSPATLEEVKAYHDETTAKWRETGARRMVPMRAPDPAGLNSK